MDKPGGGAMLKDYRSKLAEYRKRLAEVWGSL